jgi:hypothetical protein
VESEIERDYALGRQAGLPVVYGEGYHYYPNMEQARVWMREAGFRFLDKTFGDEYHHFIAQKPARAGAE